MDLRGIPDAVERFFQRHRIADTQRADLSFRNRHGQNVMGHVNSPD
jgi:hypothetical protein